MAAGAARRAPSSGRRSGPLGSVRSFCAQCNANVQYYHGTYSQQRALCTVSFSSYAVESWKPGFTRGLRTLSRSLGPTDYRTLTGLALISLELHCAEGVPFVAKLQRQGTRGKPRAVVTLARERDPPAVEAALAESRAVSEPTQAIGRGRPGTGRGGVTPGLGLDLGLEWPW